MTKTQLAFNLTSNALLAAVGGVTSQTEQAGWSLLIVASTLTTLSVIEFTRSRVGSHQPHLAVKIEGVSCK